MNMHVGASKFKVGQRVLATDTEDGQFTKGKSYEVSAVSGLSLSVKSDDRGRPNGWTLSKFIPAPLFAVGDKVRVANNVSGRVSYVGRTGVIASDDFGYGDGTSFSVKLDGDGCSLIFSALELAPAYTSCAAAEVDNLADEYGGGKVVGPREPGYRFTTKNKPQPGDRVSIGDNGTFTVKDVKDNGAVSFTDRPRDLTWLLHTNASVSACTLVQAAPTLTIQAGRYYKTRDGRKVGPASRFDFGDGYPFEVGDSYWVSESGKAQTGSAGPDLIAEWQDDVPLRGVSPVVAPATTAKFKVGDRVRQKGWRDDYWCTVTSVNATSITIKDDNGHSSPYDNLGDFIIAPTTIADIVRKHGGTAIVCLIENGQPKPSTLPFVHLNKDAAATEANRLAGIHKGQEFGVYECVDVRKEEKTYEHEWQRLAAGGQKINAIRELRGMTGLGLATTKDAVEDWLKREAA